MESPLPSCRYINHQPVMMMGLNGSEIMFVLLFALLIGMTTGTVIAVFTNTMGFLVLIGFVLTALMALISAKVLRYVKRQRPEGYYQQWMRVKTAGWFATSVVIKHSGPFDHLRHQGQGGNQ